LDIFGNNGTMSDIAIADLDGDGKLDLVTASHFSGTVTVYLNVTPTGQPLSQFSFQTFDFPTGLPSGGIDRTIVACDLNNDGKPDLIVTRENPNQVVMLENASSPAAR